MIMFEKKDGPPGHSQCPIVPPLGHDPGDRIKIISDMFCISFICENTHKAWYKNLWNWHGNRNLMIFDHWPHPKVTSLTLGWKWYLHSVLLVIPVNLICHMTMFEKKKFYPLGTPIAPKSHPWGMTHLTEWKSRLICFVSFICENTHKFWHKNLWNWLCNWN